MSTLYIESIRYVPLRKEVKHGLAGAISLLGDFYKSLLGVRRQNSEGYATGRRRLYEKEYNKLRGQKMVIQTEQISVARRIAEALRALESDGKIYRDNGSLPLKVFGVKLGALRVRRGLSLEELADLAGIDVNTLFSIELGIAPLQEIEAGLLPLGKALGGEYQYLSRLLVDLVLAE